MNERYSGWSEEMRRLYMREIMREQAAKLWSKYEEILGVRVVSPEMPEVKVVLFFERRRV